MKIEDCILLSGGARGTEAAFGTIVIHIVRLADVTTAPAGIADRSNARNARHRFGGSALTTSCLHVAQSQVGLSSST